MTRSNKRAAKKSADLGHDDRNAFFTPRKVEGWKEPRRFLKNCVLAGEHQQVHIHKKRKGDPLKQEVLVMTVRPVMMGKYYPNGDTIQLDRNGVATRIKRVQYERTA